MTKCELGKEHFNAVIQKLDNEAKKDVYSLQYDTEISADGRLYKIKLQPQAPGKIYLLQAFETVKAGGNEVIIPVFGSSTLQALLYNYIFLHCQYTAVNQT